MDWKAASSILGTSESATDEEIKEQYLYKAQLLHPDKNQDKPESIRKKAEAELSLVNQAYKFLTDPLHRPNRVPPKLQVEPLGVRFKDVDPGGKKSTTLLIKNVGGLYTSIWIDNQPAPWLAVTSLRSTGTERLPLEVIVEGTGTGVPGQEFYADLAIKLENQDTHFVDRVSVKVELCMSSAPAGASVKADPVIPAHRPAEQATPTHPAAVQRRSGFSFIRFLVNLMSLVIIGLVAGYAVYVLTAPDRQIFTLALVVYAAIAIGISIGFGFAGYPRSKIPPPKRTRP
jgi:hypothetical protein